MKNVFLPLLFLLVAAAGIAQKKQLPLKVEDVTASVVEEGTKLYQLETASSKGLAIFRERYREKLDSAGGYFSYRDNKRYKCVFFNNEPDRGILATISFDSLFSPKRTATDSVTRPMNAIEKELVAMRGVAIEDIKRDTFFFKLFSGTSVSILPIIEGKVRRVYTITTSLDPTAVVFGNDYLFEFDERNYITSRKALHTDLVAIDCFEKSIEEDENPERVVHKHKGESSDFITSTDVCVLLLNQERAKWKHHVVKSPNWVSIWYCDTNEVQTIPRKKWNKMNKEETDTEEKPVAVANKN